MAFGLKPTRYIDGKPWHGNVVQCNVVSGDGTRLGIGDAVKSDGGSSATFGAKGRPSVIRAAAGDQIFGVVVGVVPVTFDSLNYRAASTDRDVFVCLAEPNLLFQATEDGVGGFLTAADSFGVADLVIANCSTTTAISASMIDSSTLATSGSAQLKIWALANIEGNVAGTTNTIWEVLIHEIQITGDGV